MSVLSFLACEAGYSSGRPLPPALKRYGLLILIANEVRGVMIAWPLAQAWFF